MAASRLERMLKPWSMVLLNFSSSWLSTLKMKFFFSSSSGYPSLLILDHGSGKLCQELFVDAEQSSVTGSATDQTAKYIASSLIGGHDTVGDHEGSGTDMVGNQTDRNILLRIGLISYAGQSADFISQMLWIVSTSKMESTS